MKKKLFSMFYLVLFVFIVFRPMDLEAATKGKTWSYGKKIVETKGAFTYYAYTSTDKKEAWIYQIKIKDGKKCSTLSIPKKIGKQKVTRLGNRNKHKPTMDGYINIFGSWVEPWHDTDGATRTTQKIKSLTIPDTVEMIQASAFTGMHSLQGVKMSKKVTSIQEYTFYGCSNLKKVILPDKLKSLHNLAFDSCLKLDTLKLSASNSTYMIKNKCVITKKSKSLVYAIPKVKTLDIPAGTRIIKKNALYDTLASTVNIPASVKKMEVHALGRNIKNVKVSANNKVYAKDGQCIYNKNDKSLAVAIVDKNGELYISNMVEKLTTEYSVINLGKNYLKKVTYPETLNKVVVPGFSMLTVTGGKVYFTGENPPEIEKPETAIHYASLPVFVDVYVPKASLSKYKAWYKENECYSYVNSWNTYVPTE